MPSLWVLEGPHAGTQLELEGELTIGRSPTCELVVEDSNVSRRHAQLVLDAGTATLIDLGSRNGTLLNGVHLAGKAGLKPGDRIQVGPVVLAFDPDPLRLFGGAGAGPLRESALPQRAEAPLLPALRQVFENVSRAATPAACVRVAAESAVGVLGAERAFVLGFPAQATAAAEPLAIVGGLFPIPEGFEAPLRQGKAARDDRHAAVPLALPDRRQGALVLARSGKPFGEEDLALLVDVARLASRLAEGARARQPTAPTAFPLSLWRERPALLSTAFRRCLERIAHAARHHGPLLLVGEAATGRDELALMVHQLSKRADGPFVAWQQPPPDPLEPGRLPPVEELVAVLQRAEGGTLYLGNLAAWSSRLAELWLRELDRFTPSLLTSDPRVPGAVRLIAAAEDPVATPSSLGKLQTSLLARFDGERIEVPPLRKRKADLPMLVERLSALAGQRLGRAVPTFSAAAMKALGEYGWPGNLAELQVCTEWALFARGEAAEVQPWDLPPQVRAGEASDRERRQPLAELIAALERTAIAEALREAKFKKIHAAAALGISRPTLDKKIAEYQIRLKP